MSSIHASRVNIQDLQKSWSSMVRPNIKYLASQFVLPFTIGILIAFGVVYWQGKTIVRPLQRSHEDIVPDVGSTELQQALHPSMIIEPLRDMPPTNDNFEEQELELSHEVPESSFSPSDNMPLVIPPTGPSEEEVKQQAHAKEEAQRRRAEKAAKGNWTCRHRSTKWLEQNSLYLPSELNDWLRRYNRLHDKLLSEMPIVQAMKLSLTGPQNTVRYLVWRPVGEDLAGRLLSLVSAYLLALMTDRVLLINFPYVRHFFCEPFTKSSWIFPEGYLADLNRFVKLRDALQTRSPLRIARLRLGEVWVGDEIDESIFLTCNGNIKSMLTHVQVLLVESPVGFVELLASNPSHRARLESLFQGESIYSTLMHNLLHPANDMWFRIIDAYHLHYSNDYDRPARLAVNLPPPTDEMGGLRLKHRMRCALSRMPQIPFSQGRIVYYGPSSPASNPKVWAYRMMKLPAGHRLVTATDENPQPGYLDDGRRLLTDIWMGSWAQQFVFSNFTQSTLVMHYYRAKESLLVGEAEGEGEGECGFTPIAANYLAPVSHNCAAFRQSWRSKFKKRPEI